ncbi:unnamed protein product [Tilletia controversa]|uniref:Transcription initiation factor IIA large subunit n=3 Tax=Tilletia TaxID=13289 RepID=A0A8X7MNN9_9BASI|nr:hypothetical protein CF336_g6311 [Tilletia laevis]KAE8191025.1 hypothetical protein CF328_g5805 [Tilletia controversa]KAE8254261.1 hypothetical protein A4X03_0g5745 [Tilletia caries]KAE8193501.1 hypothetical protein CF335_g5571 [Tilletia laevis]KAE8243264.1 hypothetical protein A4X06_0g6442 [Tilletia controversa]
MSNKAVSGVYRNIIDNVIASVRQDFEDMGIEKEVLEELQRSWEAKVIASQVAHFEGAPALPPPTTIRKGTKQEPNDDGLSGSSKNGSKSNKAARTDLTVDVSTSRSHSAEPNGNGTGGPSSSQASLADGSDADGGKAGQKRKRALDTEEIGSDLDDTDEEDEEAEGDMNEDMVLCLYEKVTRVRNKWKCVLRDGVASIEGRDYLFSRCAGDFDWLA